MDWPYFDPEYENFSLRMNPPRVIIDNDTEDHFTLVKVASANRHGTLLEVVQLLTDLDLDISKAYISSDGGWLMDVFHVRDQLGNKIMDQGLIEFIQQSLGAKRNIPKPEVKTCLGRIVGAQSRIDHTVVELAGTDRRGLLSEISAVLTSLKCNVVAAELWTHNDRIACLVYVTDEGTNSPIEDRQRLSAIKDQLSNVLKADERQHGIRMEVLSTSAMHAERRMHQMMLADRDYQASENAERRRLDAAGKPVVTIEDCAERYYSVVNIRCKNRPKLLFDIVCTLTDLQYNVFHASIHSDGYQAHQEYYIRHVDGCTLLKEYERQSVIKCLEAAIQRRVSEGLRLEICTVDRVGLLSDLTRLLRENGLTVTRADVSTQGDMALNTFYVSDASGGPVDKKIVEALSKRIGQIRLHAKDDISKDSQKLCTQMTASQSLLAFKDLIKLHWERFSAHWGLISS